MKIVINTSNLSVGGGMQVAISFINELKNMVDHNEYFVLLSTALFNELRIGQFPENFFFFHISHSPASIKFRKNTVNELDKLVRKIDPDVVFTVFGPSYWRPNYPHLLGIADGWIYNPKTVAYSRLSFIKKLRTKLLARYKTYYIKRDANHFVVETNDAKEKIVNHMKISDSSISVVGNTHSSYYDKYDPHTDSAFLRIPPKNSDTFRLLLVSHNYEHKNISIIKDVLPYLSGYDVQFVLTIDEDSHSKLFSNLDNKVINLGPVSPRNCPSLYLQCDALFFPTLLETFSASYPEAMKMEVPILTSHYTFASSICGDAALYFDPLNPQDIANKIKILIDDECKREQLVKRGIEHIKSFESSLSRANKYISLCAKILEEEK